MSILDSLKSIKHLFESDPELDFTIKETTLEDVFLN